MIRTFNMVYSNPSLQIEKVTLKTNKIQRGQKAVLKKGNPLCLVEF